MTTLGSAIYLYYYIKYKWDHDIINFWKDKNLHGNAFENGKRQELWSFNLKSVQDLSWEVCKFLTWSELSQNF